MAKAEEEEENFHYPTLALNRDTAFYFTVSRPPNEPPNRRMKKTAPDY